VTHKFTVTAKINIEVWVDPESNPERAKELAVEDLLGTKKKVLASLPDYSVFERYTIIEVEAS